MENLKKRGILMTRLGIFGAAFVLVMLTFDATAQRGGAVRGGVRGADGRVSVVGGLVRRLVPRVGAVVGATRGAINKETQTRTQYQATPEYQNGQHSNLDGIPRRCLGTTATGTAKKPSRRRRG